MTKCPICRAAVAEQVVSCRRCQADLSQLVSIEYQAEALAGAAVRALAAHDLAQAITLARASQFRHNTPFIRGLLLLIDRTAATSRDQSAPTGDPLWSPV